MDATNATNFGTLSPKTAGASTRLSGTLTGSFAVNDNLNLYFPSTAYVSGTGVVLDYTGQDGTMATIASKYDYSVASVTATTVDNASQSFETTAATFANQQAIAGFTFVDGTTPISVSKLVISAASGKLVQKVTVGSSSTYTYGDISVTPSSATTDMVYVALNNQNGALDTYTFYVQDASSNWWTGTAKANLVAGKYYPVTGLKLSTYELSGTLNGHAWVRLYLGGLKWATHNIDLGQTSKETETEMAYCTSGQESKAYFCWAYTTSFAKEDVQKDGVVLNNGSYSGNINYDAATYNWGSTWRTPTEAELTPFTTDGEDKYTLVPYGKDVENASWETGSQKNYFKASYQGSLRVTTGESIIIPAAGSYFTRQSGNVKYTQNFYLGERVFLQSASGDAATFLSMASTFRVIGTTVGYVGLSVRPVSD
jgi:hypothetical protein